MADGGLPDFVHSLPSLVAPTHEPVGLPAEGQADVDRRCAEIDLARMRAVVSGQSYIIGGSNG